MLTPYLKKPPVRFIGAVTSLKRKPTRLKMTVASAPLHSKVYQFGKEKIINYVIKVGDYALKNVSRIARLGYNYCLPHNKLITAEELRLYLTVKLEKNGDSSMVVKVKLLDGNIHIGDVVSTTADEFTLRCWHPELFKVDILYMQIVHIYFMSDGVEYDLVG